MSEFSSSQRIAALLLTPTAAIALGACGNKSAGSNEAYKGPIAITCSGTQGPVHVGASDTFSTLIERHVKRDGITSTDFPHLVAVIALHQSEISAGRATYGETFTQRGDVHVEPPHVSAGNALRLPVECHRENS
ncbi:MAG: hypothetical protein WAT17_00595 [Candidatus Saccharimonadales bacterium]|jgi:hypothetical protein